MTIRFVTVFILSFCVSGFEAMAWKGVIVDNCDNDDDNVEIGNIINDDFPTVDLSVSANAGTVAAGTAITVTATSAATATNAAKVGSAAGFLMSDGSIKATNGTSDLTISLSGNSGANFYVVVYHRNHLPIMSATAIAASGGTYTIDFTNSAGNTYQGVSALSNLGGGKLGMIAGDQNSDGAVNGTDLTNWRSQNGGSFTYTGSSADFNLDGQVNAVDLNEYQQPNSGKSSQVPTN